MARVTDQQRPHGDGGGEERAIGNEAAQAAWSTAPLEALRSQIVAAVGRELSVEDAIGLDAAVMAVAMTEPGPAQVGAAVGGLSRWGTLLMRYTTAIAGADALGPIVVHPYTVAAGVYTRVFTAWYSGDLLTDRADELEARARVMLEALEVAPGAVRLAADAVMALPPGNTLRDEDRLRRELERAIARGLDDAAAEPLDRSRAATASDLILSGISGLVQHRFVSDDRIEGLVVAGDAIAAGPHVVDGATRFHKAVFVYRHERAGEAERVRDPTGARRQEELAAQRLALIAEGQVDATARSAINLLMRAVGAGADAPESPPAPVDDESGTSRSRTDRLALLALDHARHLTREGDYAATLAELDAILPGLEERYLGSVREEDVAAAGERYAKALNLAASVRAETGEIVGALETLDLAKSLRFRYQAMIRKGVLGGFVRDLEADIYAVHRGMAPPSGLSPLEERQLTPDEHLTELLETYRQTREKAAAGDMLLRPTMADVAAVLADDEAVAILGDTDAGILLAVVESGTGPIYSTRIDAAEAREVFAALTQFDASWLVAVSTMGTVVDRRRALLLCLHVAERIIGRRIAGALADRPVRRLTVVPHGVLHLVPYWALPSLSPWKVMTASSSAEVVSNRSREPELAGRALVVGDPTQDLPLAGPESQWVAAELRAAGLSVEVLSGSAATEDALRTAAGDAGLLHFSGHGRSELSAPLNSALETHPELLPSSGDIAELLVGLAGEATWQPVHRLAGSSWAPMELVQDAEIEGYGRLERSSWPSRGTVELRLDHGPRGTLLGQFALEEDYAVGRPLRVSELWTAGDILVEDALSGCGLAFLSACDVGMVTAASLVDEFAGLPAALALAGVGSVVSPMWQVADDVAVVFSELFYGSLLRSGPHVSVLDLVDQARHRVRTATRDDVLLMLEALRERAGGASERFKIDVAVERVAGGPEHPYAHPIDWAAFHVVGSSTLRTPLPDTATLPGFHDRTFVLPPGEDEGRPRSQDTRSTISDLADSAETLLRVAESGGDPSAIPSLKALAAEWLRKRAEARLADGDTDGAVTDLLRVLEIEPSDRDALLAMGSVLLDERRFVEAEDYFGRVVEVAIDDPKALLYRGLAREAQGDQRAHTDYTAVIEHTETPLRPYALEARAHLLAASDPWAAVADVDAAIELRPEKAELYKLRADIVGDLGRWSDAVSDGTKALILAPLDPDAHITRGLALAEVGAYEAAVSDYESAMSLQPDNVAAYFNRACARSRAHQADDVVGDLTRAFQLDPDLVAHARIDPDLEWARTTLPDVTRLLADSVES